MSNGNVGEARVASLNAMGLTESVDGALLPLRQRIDTIRTVADQSQAISDASGLQEQIQALLQDKDGILAESEFRGESREATEARLVEFNEATGRCKTRAERAKTLPDASAFQEAVGGEGFQDRRTHASRVGYARSEGMQRSLLETAASAQAHYEPKVTPLDLAPASESERQRRERIGSLRETTDAVRAGRVRAVAEVAYRALPMDAEEKAPHRQVVIEQVEELAQNGNGDGTAAQAELFDAVDALAATVEPTGLVEAVSAAAADAESPLGSVVERFGSLIENRVVAAYTRTRIETQALERAINEATSDESADQALVESRVRRIEREHRPNLIESLFQANARALGEAAGGEVPQGAILTEAVGQYTAIETLSSLGIAEITDVEMLARNVARISPK